MKSAAFIHLIASTYTKPVEAVAVYARALREASLLTTGARGRNAPEMTPLDAARMTIAILTTDSPSECVERVQRFGNIKYSPGYRRSIRGYETMQPDQFAQVLQGETLEEVLAYIYSLPAVLGTDQSVTWYSRNPYHLRISDFHVLAELYRQKIEDREVVGELVVPFKGDVMVRTEDGFRHVDGFKPIKGGVVNERSISAGSFSAIGLGLFLSGDTKEPTALTTAAALLAPFVVKRPEATD